MLKYHADYSYERLGWFVFVSEYDAGLSKVYSGPFSCEAEAERAARALNDTDRTVMLFARKEWDAARAGASISEEQQLIEQLASALCKLYKGYAPGDAEWREEDQQAVELAMEIAPIPTKEKEESNVVTLLNITSLDLPPDRVLQASIGKMKGVVLLGYDKEGSEYFASTYADGGTVIWMLERCKKRLLDIPEEL